MQGACRALALSPEQGDAGVEWADVLTPSRSHGKEPQPTKATVMLLLPIKYAPEATGKSHFAVTLVCAWCSREEVLSDF